MPLLRAPRASVRQARLAGVAAALGALTLGSSFSSFHAQIAPRISRCLPTLNVVLVFTGRQPPSAAIREAVLRPASLSAAEPFLGATDRRGDNWVDEDVCTDTCTHARDGVCQEGRAGRGPAATGDGTGPFEVLCALGTDCSDCGPWRYVGPAYGLEWDPVRDLRERGVTLNVRATKTPLPFWMPYTDPAADIDVSGQMADISLIEPGLSWVWYKILKDGCLNSNHSSSGGDGDGDGRALVLDVGANFGYYSLMSAAMGCRVIAWEPVPKFAAFFRYGLLRNLFVGAVELRPRVVAAQGGRNLTLVVPTTGIWGTAGIGGANLDPGQRAAATESVSAVAERVDDAVPPQRILIMKVDVEGFEPGVLTSSKGLFKRGLIENVFMEYSPGVAESAGDWTAAAANPGRLLGLKRAGYSILHLNENLRVVQGFAFDGELPPMREVSETALRHDLDDVERAKEGTLGCPLPKKVAAAGLWTCPAPGFEIERLSPKGFRPSFGYNTNIWLIKDVGASAATPVGHAALMAPDTGGSYDVTEWFLSSDESYPYFPGHTFRRCSELAPHEQVRFRCHCTHPDCAAIEAAVTAAAARENMPPRRLSKEKAANPAK